MKYGNILLEAKVLKVRRDRGENVDMEAAYIKGCADSLYEDEKISSYNWLNIIKFLPVHIQAMNLPQ